jgi:hypothetical protein
MTPKASESASGNRSALKPQNRITDKKAVTTKPLKKSKDEMYFCAVLGSLNLKSQVLYIEKTKLRQVCSDLLKSILFSFEKRSKIDSNFGFGDQKRFKKKKTKLFRYFSKI